MSDTFFAYLRRERERLEREIARARAAPAPDAAEIAGLLRQTRVVEDELARWSSDLADRMAAA